MSYTLINGQELHKESPETFYIPSKEEIEQLKTGDLVKLIFVEDSNMPERMWVEIFAIEEGGRFRGKLRNDPFELKSIKHDDLVIFSEEHIINIY